jgi:hypothetical protein
MANRIEISIRNIACSQLQNQQLKHLVNKLGVSEHATQRFACNNGLWR